MKLSGFRINCEFGWRKRLVACVSAVLAAILALAALPATAFADYSNPTIDTVAQMRTDGSLHVVEQRSYVFDEDYSVVVWPFTGITDKQEVEIASVRLIRMDGAGNITRDWVALEEVPFQSAWRDFVEDTGGEASKVRAAEEKLARSADPSDAVELPSGDSYSFDKRHGKLYVFLGASVGADAEIDAGFSVGFGAADGAGGAAAGGGDDAAAGAGGAAADATTAAAESTVIECDYAISDAALVYDDTAEMYWDYIAAQPDVETSNVQVQIQLPVPEGVEVVPGQTVLAWGHGPEGTVEVRADGTVHYLVPEAKPGQYAQAHVLFPRAWLTNITVQSKLAKSGTRFDDAVAEEESWTDTYSWGKANALSMDLGLLALCALALVGSVAAYALWGRERRPEADDAADGNVGARAAMDAAGVEAAAATDAAGVAPAATACGSDGADDAEGAFDAAVIGRLLRWNQHSVADFVATLRQLERRKVISISESGTGGIGSIGGSEGLGGLGCSGNRSVGAGVDGSDARSGLVAAEGFAGRAPGTPGAPAAPGAPAVPEGVRFRITPQAKQAELSVVERGAMKILFDIVGDGYQSVSLSEVQDFCRKNPARAREAMGEWQSDLSEAVRAAKLFDLRSKKASRWLFGIAIAFAALAALEFSAHNTPIALAAIATAAVVFAIGYNMPHRTPQGVQLAERVTGDGDNVTVTGDGDNVTIADQPDWETLMCEAFDEALVA